MRIVPPNSTRSAAGPDCCRDTRLAATRSRDISVLGALVRIAAEELAAEAAGPLAGAWVARARAAAADQNGGAA